MEYTTPSEPQPPEPGPARDPAPRPAAGGNLAAIAATVTAVVAIVIALWDNVQTREHNRLSVLPYVDITRFQQDSSGVARGDLVYSNEGVGPAMMRGAEIRLKLAEDRDTTVTRWSDLVPLMRERGVLVTGYVDVDSGAAVGVQRGGNLLSVRASGEGGGQVVQDLFDDLAVRLRYASVYGVPAEAVLGEWPGE